MNLNRDPSKPTLQLYEIRKLAIIAMFADDVLFSRLALKGGNALDVVLGIAGRTSIDIDFSIEGEFEDLEDIKHRTGAALRDRFDSAGFSVFDFTFEERPTIRRAGLPPEWGGYEIKFKIIRKELGDLGREDRRFIQAETVGPGFQKTLTIQISHHEYTRGSVEKDLDDFKVVVYTPAMIAIEKIRAICQQIPSYGLVQSPRPRARDFYDIHRICEVRGVRLDTEACGELLVHMFDAKRVPLKLLGEIKEYKDFHEQNWSEVIAAARDPLRDESFEFYFDYVLERVAELKLPRHE